MNVADALKATALFKGFTDTGLRIIGSICTARSFPKGVPLFAESMLADALLIIVKGSVELSTKTLSGDEASLGVVGQGDYLGELSLVHPGQRLCTATALSEVTALEIRHADFQKLLASKPQACIKLLMSVVSRFGQKVVDNKEGLKSLLSKP